MIRLRHLALPLVALLTACAAPEKAPEDHFYRLVDEPPPVVASRSLAGLAEVERVEAHGLYRDRAIVFSRSDAPETLDRHRYHFWALPPTEMLRQHFASHLRGSNLVEQVSTGELQEIADLRIRLILRQFERVIDATGGVSARVAMRGVAERDGRTLIARDLEWTEPAADATPGSSVRAMSAALSALYAEFVTELAAALGEPN